MLRFLRLLRHQEQRLGGCLLLLQRRRQRCKCERGDSRQLTQGRRLLLLGALPLGRVLICVDGPLRAYRVEHGPSRERLSLEREWCTPRSYSLAFAFVRSEVENGTCALFWQGLGSLHSRT